MPETPTAGEKLEAKKHPNGWVYRIDKNYSASGEVPPDKIIGAWKVDQHGQIVDGFIRNEKYQKSDGA